MRAQARPGSGRSAGSAVGPAAWATLTAAGRMGFHIGIPGLRDLQDAVGGYVEAVGFQLAGSEATLWIAEEGKLDAAVLRNSTAEIVAPPWPGDWIAGDAAFTGGAGPDGETLALTAAQVAELRRIDRDVRVVLLRGDGAVEHLR